MNRTGLEAEELKKIRKLILSKPELVELKGLCTHYAGAENIGNYFRIKKQIANFNKVSKWFDKNDLHPAKRHTACSAAIVNYPSTIMDMVRVGIMQYEFWPSKETLIRYLGDQDYRENPLKRLISWKSKVMSVKEVKVGEFIGYGTTYLAEKNMKIATVPVGYSDGYSRSLSNTGRVLINGRRAGVVGIVNMNMIVADVTHCPETKKGDEVVLIGDQGEQSISVASFSELSSQLNYELLTRLPGDIPRRIIP
jgi:alanine racemase